MNEYTVDELNKCMVSVQRFFNEKKKFEMIVLGFPRANATRADSISFAHTLALPNVYSRVCVS